MPGIWINEGQRWEHLIPRAFPDEVKLHNLVEEAPQLLPLAGSPQLAVVGREVQLGSGKADLIAVEASGRLAVIEVKLAQNAEARRAVIAQVLAYAAYLHGLTLTELQADVLDRHLRQRGFGTLMEAAESVDQQGAVDPQSFEHAAESFLSEGVVRLVLVLDDAPQELVRLVGYLQIIASGLLIDVVTVSEYVVGDSHVVMPQRVDPEQARQPDGADSRKVAGSGSGEVTEGAGGFEAAIDDAPEEQREKLRRMCDWAKRLEAEGVVRLFVYHGKGGRKRLLLYWTAAGPGLATVSKDPQSSYLQLWRSVFDRFAPTFIASIEKHIGQPIRQGTTEHNPDEDLLGLVAAAYREAAN